jgi:putative addiction module component (TIGR02574 family)
MSLPLEQLESAALELSSRERAALAHRLIVSLDESPDDDPTEVELAWEAEIRDRIDAYRRGDIEAVPSSSEVFAKARALLK